MEVGGIESHTHISGQRLAHIETHLSASLQDGPSADPIDHKKHGDHEWNAPGRRLTSDIPDLFRLLAIHQIAKQELPPPVFMIIVMITAYTADHFATGLK
jgi:hypothetical protein